MIIMIMIIIIIIIIILLSLLLLLLLSLLSLLLLLLSLVLSSLVLWFIIIIIIIIKNFMVIIISYHSARINIFCCTWQWVRNFCSLDCIYPQTHPKQTVSDLKLILLCNTFELLIFRILKFWLWKISSHFDVYLGFGLIQVDEIHSVTSIYNVCSTQPTRCLLMHWRLLEPVHQKA